VFDPDLIEAEQARLEKAGLLKHTDKIVDPVPEIMGQLRFNLINNIFTEVRASQPHQPPSPGNTTPAVDSDPGAR
jgi:hypothetical protein